jgi:hypothetical protein
MRDRSKFGVLVGLPLWYAFRTLAGHLATSEMCRYCSLIPGLGVKLSNDHPCRAIVLSAVGVNPPHDGVR